MAYNNSNHTLERRPDTFCKVMIRGILINRPKISTGSTVMAEFNVQTKAPWRPSISAVDHPCICYGKAVTQINRANPGDIVFMEGFLRNDEYQDVITKRIYTTQRIVADFVHVATARGEFIHDIEAAIENDCR